VRATTCVSIRQRLSVTLSAAWQLSFSHSLSVILQCLSHRLVISLCLLLSTTGNVAVVLIQSIFELDGKYSERVQLPAKVKFGVFYHHYLATLATFTIRSIKCKQSPVYGVF